MIEYPNEDADGDSNPALAAVLRSALENARAERVKRGEYARLTHEALGRMLADWLGDPEPYSGETVRTWITKGRDPGLSAGIALFAILDPTADLAQVARDTYRRRVAKGGKGKRKRGDVLKGTMPRAGQGTGKPGAKKRRAG